MKYRSKPTECEAVQWVTSFDLETEAKRIVAWVNANGGEARYEDGTSSRFVGHLEPHIEVRTINGTAYAAPGHYVVMGTATFVVTEATFLREAERCRDFYPCDPETFERRWEPTS